MAAGLLVNMGENAVFTILATTAGAAGNQLSFEIGEYPAEIHSGPLAAALDGMAIKITLPKSAFGVALPPTVQQVCAAMLAIPNEGGLPFTVPSAWEAPDGTGSAIDFPKTHLSGGGDQIPASPPRPFIDTSAKPGYWFSDGTTWYQVY